MLVQNKLNLSEYSHIFLLCLWETNWTWVNTLTSSFSACEKQTESDWILSHLPSLLVRNKLSPSDYSHIFRLCLWETNWSEWILSHLPSVLVRNKLNLSEYSHIFRLLVRNKLSLSEYSHIFLLCLWETNWIWVNTLTSAFYACEIQTESKWLLSHLPSLFVRNKLNLSEYSHIFLLCLWETNWTWVNTLTSSFYACEKQTEPEWILSHLPSMLVRYKLSPSDYSHIFLLCLWDTNWVQVTTLTSSVSVCKKQTEPEWILSHLPSMLVRNKLNLSEYSHIFLLCLWDTNWVQVTTLTSSFYACEKQTEPEWIFSHLPSLPVRNKLNLTEYSHIFLLCLWETNWVQVTTLTSSFYACEIQTESKWLLSHLPSLFVRNKLIWVNTLTSSFSACEKQTESEWILSHLHSMLVRYKLSPSDYSHIFLLCLWETNWSEWILSHLPSMLVRNKLNLSEYSQIFLLCLWETNWIWVNTLTSSFSACEIQTESKWLLSHLPSLFVRNKLIWVNTLTSSFSACEKQTESEVNTLTSSFSACEKQTESWVNTLTSSVSACEKQTESEWILSHLPSMLVRNKLNLSEYSHIFRLCLWDTNWVSVTILTSSVPACEKQTYLSEYSHIFLLCLWETNWTWVNTLTSSVSACAETNWVWVNTLHIFLLCLWETNWTWVNTLTSSFSACEKQTESDWILSHLPSLLVRNKLSPSDYSHIFRLCLWETNWSWVNTLTSSFYACAETNWTWVNTLSSSFSACEKQTESEWILSHLPSMLVRNKLNLSEYSHIFLLCLWDTNWVQVTTLTSSVSACEKQTDPEWILSHLPSMLVRNKLNLEWILSHLPSMLMRNKLNLSECSHIFLLCLWDTNWVQVTTLTSSFYACEIQTESKWLLSHLPSLFVRNKLNLSEYSHIFLLCLWETN